MRHLSEADIAPLLPSPAQARQLITALYRRLAADTGIRTAPKQVLALADGGALQAMLAADPALGLGLLKYVGIAATGEVPALHLGILLSAYPAMTPLAWLEAAAITALRTAAMSALAAEALLHDRPPRRLALIGAGVQARSHLAALKALFPSLARLRVHARSAASARRLLDEAEAVHGLAGELAVAPNAVLEDADLIVSATALAPGKPAFLEPGRVEPGALVCAADLGRPWRFDGTHGGGFDRLWTDDSGQSERLHAIGKLPCGGPFEADLRGLCGAGVRPLGAGERGLFLFAGHAPADLAIAAHCWRLANRTDAP